MGILSLRNSVISLMFLIALALSGWSVLVSQKSLSQTAEDTNQPDAYMENVVATFMNKDGTPSLKIEAPSMVHYAENDNARITQPHVTVYRQSLGPWYINSDSARTLHGVDEIIFSNNVVIHHPTDKNNPNTTLQTETLTVLPNKQQAETDNPVVITQPDTVVHAIGMLADLNNGTIKLLSQATGDYVPHA